MEFGFQDSANTETANFTDSHLIVTDVVNGTKSNASFKMTFTDTAFAGQNVQLLSNSFPGTFSFSQVGDMITVNWGGGTVSGTLQAEFLIAPEPATLGLVGVGLVGLVGYGLRRRLKKKA